MLKIGVIGLGDIARKAYLPVISRTKSEVHLCSRVPEKLAQVGAEYRFDHLHDSMASLIRSGITAAFVHTPSDTHFDIVKQLLSNHIHVYVDKPLTPHFKGTKELLDFAREKNCILRVGFNRRFAPAYQSLRKEKDPSMILMQKNRNALPGEVRNFIFEDFIHVIDTLLYLFQHPITKIIVNGKKSDGLLCHVVVQLISAAGHTAIGIMNRDSGTVQERVEIFTSERKTVVYNVTDTVVFQDKNEIRVGPNDWESTLLKRGFEGIVADFLGAVENGISFPDHYDDILLTHTICEQIVEALEREGSPRPPLYESSGLS